VTPGIWVAIIEKSNIIDNDAKDLRMFKLVLLNVVALLIAATVTVFSVKMLTLCPAQYGAQR